MNSSDSTQTQIKKILVLPGDELGDDDFKAGSGTYKLDGKVHAAQLGIMNISRDFINVISLSGIYIPKPGDSVIGIIIDNGPSSWMVDIGCPYTAMMHTNDVQWNVKYGEAGKYLKPGDAILAKVSSVSETKKTQLTMKEHGLRKIEGGLLVKVAHSKVPRVIGKGGSMISLLKQKTNTRMFVGQNGMIWLDGENQDMERASAAIRLIDEKTQTTGLTEEISNFLEGTGSGVSSGSSTGFKEE